MRFAFCPSDLIAIDIPRSNPPEFRADLLKSYESPFGEVHHGSLAGTSWADRSQGETEVRESGFHWHQWLGLQGMGERLLPGCPPEGLSVLLRHAIFNGGD